ncbi:MAG: hypothetical protein JWR40_3190 [Massilia sp.]|nr:hypothetical protein [Massilia sp.]
MSLQAVSPQPGSAAAAALPLATFADVAFREPETDADQQRVLGTVRLDDKTGYFVDIFRSRRRDGKDRHHDYIYHNLGQSMQLQTPAGQPLATAPTARLAFADGDPTGYDYWWDRKSLASSQPLKARFDRKLPDSAVSMTAWLQGSSGREFFRCRRRRRLRGYPACCWRGWTSCRCQPWSSAKPARHGRAHLPPCLKR